MSGDRLYQGSTMGELIARALARFPRDRAAFIEGGRTVTYGEFADRLSQIIQALKAAGLERGGSLAYLSGNKTEAFMVVAATWMIGARYTALHPLGGADDHRFILEDAEVEYLYLDTEGYAEKSAALLEKRPPLLKQAFTSTPSNLGTELLAEADKYPVTQPVSEAAEDDLAALIYTGGTTGRPKGVVHCHRQFTTNVLMTLAEWQWPREIRLLVATPISHASGILITPTLLKGGTVVMMPGFDADAFLDIVEQHKITATFLVPTMIYVLLDHPRIRTTDLSSLDLVIYGAAPMSPSRMQEAIDVFGQVFMQLYAQSEAPNTVTALFQWDHDPVNHPERLASCGVALTGNQVAVLGPDDRPVPDGEVGEICVRGPLVMNGYWKRPEETAKTLRNGWLHTGDMGRRDAHGYYYLVDRSKDMIISGGFNVYPREVEDALTAHPSVASAAVIGIPDDKWGEAVKALVVAKSGETIDEDTLKAHVKAAKGSVYTPKSIEIVDDLPVTALGKLDKKAIRAKFWGDLERQIN